MEFDLGILGGKHLVPVLALALEVLRVCGRVLSLLLLIPFNPHISGSLLTIDDVIEVSNFLVQLLFAEFKLPLDSLLFGVEGLVSPL